MLKVSLLLAVVGLTSVCPAYASDRPLTEPEKKIIAGEYGQRLKDPLSAQYRWPNLIKSTSSKPDEMVYCFQVNAKNSYGAYVGFQTVLGRVSLRNGTVIGYSYKMGAESNPIMNEAASEFCDVSRYKF